MASRKRPSKICCLAHRFSRFRLWFCHPLVSYMLTTRVLLSRWVYFTSIHDELHPSTVTSIWLELQVPVGLTLNMSNSSTVPLHWVQDAVEHAECEATVKEHATSVQAMKRRGIDDMDLVMVERTIRERDTNLKIFIGSDGLIWLLCATVKASGLSLDVCYETTRPSTQAPSHFNLEMAEFMERLHSVRPLVHLMVAMFLHMSAFFLIQPAITDVTLAAICPGKKECSRAIYLSGFQQVVEFPKLLLLLLSLFPLCISWWRCLCNYLAFPSPASYHRGNLVVSCPTMNNLKPGFHK